ncbi:MAG: L-serine ammonia-lyase, iron-sulfur-dependent subunit beta [Oscillospiraceae bacterium]|nr:L-serine ammonia-lyase, iron-sulfur-dependent subunit beta [Oscillospiraceae bacterium]
MNISLFDIIGPVMVGPSSSHTAGAARLGYVAAVIAEKPFAEVHFGLHGSFAKTGRGHGTHEALLAGTLGIREDDERLKIAFQIAQQRGIRYHFEELELADCHENTARITFINSDGTSSIIEGSSIGGGRIRITRIDDMPTDFSAECPTILITQRDAPGVVREISGILAENAINIAVMRVTRTARGDIASTVIETDSKIPASVQSALCTKANILSVRMVDVRE